MFLTQSIKNLQAKSDRVLDGFRKALADYTAINEQIDKAIDDESRIIEQAMSNRNSLTGIKEENNKFINRLNQFFN